jgi:hypothetical protein
MLWVYEVGASSEAIRGPMPIKLSVRVAGSRGVKVSKLIYNARVIPWRGSARRAPWW